MDRTNVQLDDAFRKMAGGIRRAHRGHEVIDEGFTMVRRGMQETDDAFEQIARGLLEGDGARKSIEERLDDLEESNRQLRALILEQQKGRE